MGGLQYDVSPWPSLCPSKERRLQSAKVESLATWTALLRFHDIDIGFDRARSIDTDREREVYIYAHVDR